MAIDPIHRRVPNGVGTAKEPNKESSPPQSKGATPSKPRTPDPQGEARERLHAMLDRIGDRPLTAAEIVAIRADVAIAYQPQTCAARIIAALVRTIVAERGDA